eukprot:1214686-Prymnesium_polylepis.1
MPSAGERARVGATPADAAARQRSCTSRPQRRERRRCPPQRSPHSAVERPRALGGACTEARRAGCLS